MDDHLLRFDKEKVYCFIDFETENLCLNNSHNLPWQVAMIKAVDGKKIDEKNFYIKWPRKVKVSKEAARITRFNLKKYEEIAVPHDQIFPTVEDWLDNSDYVLGHNILGFDLYFWMNNMDWEAANEAMTGDLTRAEVLAGNFLGKVSMGTWSNLSNTCKTATEVNIGLTLAAAADSKSVYVSGVVTSGTPTLAAVDDIVLNLGIIKD